MKNFKTTFMVALMLMNTFVSVQPLYAETRTADDCNLIAKERSEILDFEQEAEKDKQERFLGEFELTFYCSCQKCCSIPNSKCANGEYPKEGLTVACDPKVIPLGTYIEIEGFGVRKCMDTGNLVKSNILDVYVSSHEKALKLGRIKNVKVYLSE